jgi:hypothetical protein
MADEQPKIEFDPPDWATEEWLKSVGVDKKMLARMHTGEAAEIPKGWTSVDAILHWWETEGRARWLSEVGSEPPSLYIRLMELIGERFPDTLVQSTLRTRIAYLMQQAEKVRALEDENNLLSHYIYQAYGNARGKCERGYPQQRGLICGLCGHDPTDGSPCPRRDDAR